MPPWTLDDLQRALDAHGALPTTNPPCLSVVHLRSDDTAETLVLDIESNPERGRQRWRLTLDHALADLAEEDASLDSAALIVRANVEEWWHLKDVEPATARIGVLLSG